MHRCGAGRKAFSDSAGAAAPPCALSPGWPGAPSGEHLALHSLPDGAQPTSFCDQYSEKGFLHPAGWVSRVEGGEVQGPLSFSVGELISGLASPPPSVDKQAGKGREGGGGG